MKKVFALLILVLFCTLSTVMAQGGGGQQMTPEQRLAMQKERYKGLGLNDVQVDSVIAISADFRPRMMALRDMAVDERATKMKEINDDRNKRIEKALGADLAKKVIESLSAPRGGRGGGGN